MRSSTTVRYQMKYYRRDRDVDPLFLPRNKEIPKEGQVHVLEGGSTFIVMDIHAVTNSHAILSFRVEEEVHLGYMLGGVLHSNRARVEGGDRSPTQEWSYRDGPEEYRLVAMASSLVLDQVTGSTREDFIRDLVLATCRDNKAAKAWVRKWFPEWVKLMLDPVDGGKEEGA